MSAKQERDEWQRLSDAATFAPWKQARQEYDSHEEMARETALAYSRGGHVLHYLVVAGAQFPAFTGNGPSSMANAAFIAAAREAVPTLLQDVAALTAERDAADFERDIARKARFAAESERDSARSERDASNAKFEAQWKELQAARADAAAMREAHEMCEAKLQAVWGKEDPTAVYAEAYGLWSGQLQLSDAGRALLTKHQETVTAAEQLADALVAQEAEGARLREENAALAKRLDAADVTVAMFSKRNGELTDEHAATKWGLGRAHAALRGVVAESDRSTPSYDEAHAILADAAAPSEPPVDDVGRCAICAWPLAKDGLVSQGCVRGNCSFRGEPPIHPTQRYAPARAEIEAAALRAGVKP